MSITKYKQMFEGEEGITQDEEYVKLHISNTLRDYLLDLKKPGANNNYEVGDKVLITNRNQGRLSDEIHDFLQQSDIFTVKRINKAGKLDLGYFTRYKREEDQKLVRKTFYFSKNRFMNLKKLDNVAAFLLGLLNVEKDMLLDNYVDYFDVDNKGNISYLPMRYFDDGNHYKSTRRIATGIGRLLRRVYKPEIVDKIIKPRDIEMFSNSWAPLFDNSYKVEILEGDDILDAYTDGKISDGWKRSSCANSTKPDKNRFKVYTENTENVKCLVVKHKGKIYGRRMMFVGIQTEDHGIFKKGQEYTMLNGPYCEGGYDSKVDKIMKRWAKQNNAHLVGGLKYDKKDPSIFRIRIQNTCYTNYPPFDSFSVNMFSNELAYGNGNIRQMDINKKTKNHWQSAYGARCTLDKKKLKEKEDYLKKIGAYKEPEIVDDNDDLFDDDFMNETYNETKNDKKVNKLKNFFDFFKI